MRPRALLALESQALRESGIATSQWGLDEKMASLSILSSSVNTLQITPRMSTLRTVEIMG